MSRFAVPLALGVSLFAGLPAAAQQGASLPEGPGRDIVGVACTQCHGPSAFTQLRMNAVGWRNQVYDMILRGAQIGPDDIDAAVKYLTASFGPGVNVPPSRQVTLPDGSGKEIVEGGCGLCHGIDRVAEARRSKEDWTAIVQRMVQIGAPLTADQEKSAVDYLSAKLGPGGKTASAQ